MLIVSRRKLATFNGPLCLTIDRNSIKQVSFRRFLGVYTDKNLPWNILISKYLKRSCLWHWHLQAKYVLCPIWNAPMHLSCFSSTSFKFLWGNCNKSLATKLQKLQNRTARILTSSSYDANVDDLFVRLGSGKNLIFDENSEKKQRIINYLMVLPLIIWN